GLSWGRFRGSWASPSSFHTAWTQSGLHGAAADRSAAFEIIVEAISMRLAQLPTVVLHVVTQYRQDLDQLLGNGNRLSIARTSDQCPFLGDAPVGSRNVGVSRGVFFFEIHNGSSSRGRAVSYG